MTDGEGEGYRYCLLGDGDVPVRDALRVLKDGGYRRLPDVGVGEGVEGLPGLSRRSASRSMCGRCAPTWPNSTEAGGATP